LPVPLNLLTNTASGIAMPLAFFIELRFISNICLTNKFHTQPMSRHMTEPEIRDLLKKMEAYIETHLDAVLSVAKEYFGDGEIKTGTMISRYFRSDMHSLHPILDFLSEKGYLSKVSQTIRITPKSKPAVEEVAFVMPQE